MARQPRLHLPGAVHHVILRGNGRMRIFRDEADRAAWYALLSEGVVRFGYRVHAFCLMPNHVHLALQAGAEPLSAGLQNLAFRYTRHFNGRDGRVGHLFEGRYKAFLVDQDRYLVELVRYIHTNPVRAGLVPSAGDFLHSSHAGYLGLADQPFLTTDWVLHRFSPHVGTARRRFAEFVARGNTEGHREDFHGGSGDRRVIGDDRFTEEVLAAAGARDDRRPVALSTVVAAVCAATGVSPDLLAAQSRGRRAAGARALVGWLATGYGGATLTEVAARLGRDVSTLSRAVTALDASMRAAPAEVAAWERRLGVDQSAVGRVSAAASPGSTSR